MDKFEQLKQLEKLKSLKTDTPTTNDPSSIEDEASKYLEEAKNEIKYGDSELRTFGESALSSASLGLSDQALIKSGITTAEDIKLRREFNPASNIAGQVTGVVAPALLTGGTSVAAKVAAATPAALASKAGANVTKALASAIKDKAAGSTLKNIITRSLPATAGSAVEGSLYGLGELISENALGDKKFNAENALKYSLYGAGLGAAGQGLVSAGSKVTKAAASKGKQLISKNSNTADLTLDMLGTTPSRKIFLQNKHGDYLSEAATNVNNIIKNKGDLSTFKSTKKYAKSYLDEIDAKGKEIGDIINLASDSGIALSRKDVLKSQIDDVTELFLSKIRNQETVKKLRQELKDPALSYTDQTFNLLKRSIDSADLKDDLISVLKYRKDLIDSFNNSEGVLYNAKMLQEDKKYIDQTLKSVWKREDTKTDLLEQAYLKSRDVYKNSIQKIANSIPDQDLGARLTKANKDYHDLKIFEKEVAKMSEKDKSFLDNILNREGSVLALSTMLGIPDLVGTGIAVNKVLKSDALKRAKVLKSIEDSSKQTESKINTSIKNFFKAKSNPATAISTKILINSTLSGREGKKPSTDAEAIDNIRENIQDLKSNPNLMLNTVGRYIAPYREAAPETANEMVQIFANKINYLESKLPIPKYDNGVISKFSKQPSSLSTIEAAKFRRIVNTLENPTSVLDDLSKGTITREQTEALKAVYPSIYAKIQDSVMEYITQDQKAKLSYQQRINLGILLDIPTDRSISPEFIQQLQLSYPIEESQTEQATGKYAALTNSNIKTPVQQTEES